jgi:chitinase
MRNLINCRFFKAFAFLIVATICSATRTPAGLWTTAYYPGWEQAGMPASNIDFAALTHVIHFSLVPNLDGTLNSTDNSISVSNSDSVVSLAHAAGRKVIICVGGAKTESLFQSAASSTNLPAFINNLTNFMASRGYDGVDIDWEPLPSTDAGLFTNLVNGLRSALDTFPQHKLLTAAAGAYPPFGDSTSGVYAMYAQIQNQFDQINVMVYDLSGPYEGWVTWFNSPIYDGGYRFPSDGLPVPSLNGSINNFLSNHVAAAKIGVSIAFYGYLWTEGTGPSTNSITQPRQSWTTAPTITALDYSEIMDAYYQSNQYHWDTNDQAAYLSVTNADPRNNEFISYDDQRTCQAKVSYARNHDLGGIMIWEIAQDHVGVQPGPLMQALKQALSTPGLISLQKSNNDMDLTFDAIALGSYRVQWTSNMFGGPWNTLLITNFPGPGIPLQIKDTGAATNQPWRFYRVQTPP